MKMERVESDVLCVGGGIAGLMGAIRAAELGVSVVIAEKGNTLYSGSGRAGNDHFWAYIPEYHGPDMNLFIRESMLGQLGYMLSGLPQKMVKTWVERSSEMVELWNEWGIPMKQNGKIDFSGHAFPGHMLTHVKYRGAIQKRVLTEQALKRGVKIMDRVMVFDLLGDVGGVTGAVAIDTRENRFFVFRAKSVILATGLVIRMYPNIIPAMMANNTRPFTVTGDGRSMAYRLGAELSNMEMISNHAGVKNYARAGQGSWPGVCTGPDGKPIGKYITRPDTKHGDIIMEVDKRIFQRHAHAGTGPVYMDCRGISQGDYEYLIRGLENEGNIGLLEHIREEGIDLKKNALEFATYEMRCGGRIESNERAETTIPGLFTAGEESTYSISGAAVFGWIGGENAAEFARKRPAIDNRAMETQIEQKKDLVSTFLENKRVTDWFDANTALNHTLADYAGPVRSETMLKAGLEHLRRLKRKLHTMVAAKDRWELTRCLEVVNLYDLGELVFIAALERKESRGLHQRVDYPYSDPLLNGKILVIKNIKGNPVTEWKEINQ
ncbi:MAG: FAD-binding protein [Deltaproteobacteria bacterium]|nr:FAD-binding protein [Deltaproteobacteria bacterium]